MAKTALDRVKVASPCTADWSAMKGDERVRHCGQCDKNVYNLSAMPAAEALSLVEGNEGRICVRFYRRADGTMLTSDCPVGAMAAGKRRRRSLGVGAAAMASLVAGGLFSRASATQGAPRPLPIADGGNGGLGPGEIGEVVREPMLEPMLEPMMGAAVPMPYPEDLTEEPTGEPTDEPGVCEEPEAIMGDMIAPEEELQQDTPPEERLGRLAPDVPEQLMGKVMIERDEAPAQTD